MPGNSCDQQFILATQVDHNSRPGASRRLAAAEPAPPLRLLSLRRQRRLRAPLRLLVLARAPLFDLLVPCELLRQLGSGGH